MAAQVESGEWERIDSVVGFDHWDLSAFDDQNCAVSIDSAGVSSILQITDDGWKTRRTIFLDSSTLFTKPVHSKWEYRSVAMVVRRGEEIRLDVTSPNTTLYLLDALGRTRQTHTLRGPGSHTIEAPRTPGLYFLHTKKQNPKKILVH